MEQHTKFPKICVESKSSMIYIQKKIKKELITQLKKQISFKNLTRNDEKLAFLICEKWLQRVFEYASHNIEINGQGYDKVMINQDDFEPLNLEVQNELNRLTQKRDKLLIDLCIRLRVHTNNEIKRRYLTAINKSISRSQNFAETEGFELPCLKNALDSLKMELEKVPARTFDELKESVQLLSEISEEQTTTNSKLQKVNESISARECHTNSTKSLEAYRPLSEEEEELFNQPDLPGEIVKEILPIPLSKLTYEPPLSLNKRYRNRLLNRRRFQGKRLS